MAKGFERFAVIGVIASALAGCQSIDTAKIKYVKETDQSELNALIYCTGTDDCEFERFNKTPIIDSDSFRLDKQAVHEGIVRLQMPSLNHSNALYLSVPAGVHEVVVRFYPISKDKAETINIIHKFNPKTKYTLKMFRSRSNNKGSLLNVSAPEPLCVDLKQEQRTIRRFCKPYNVLTGLGEFVEKKNFKSR